MFGVGALVGGFFAFSKLKPKHEVDQDNDIAPGANNDNASDPGKARKAQRGDKFLDDDGNELIVVPKPTGRKKKASQKPSTKPKSSTNSSPVTLEAEKATTQKNCSD